MLAPLLGSRVPVAPGQVRLTALDVGQGMAVLVESGDRTLLYDTGPAWGSESDAGARIILPHLRARGIERLDLLVISHPDADHVGGAASVLEGIPADEVVATLPDEHPAARLAPARTQCSAGRRWRWADLEIRALHPQARDPLDGTLPENAASTKTVARATPDNASSCVLLISGPFGRVLLAGDIGAAQERSLVAAHGAKGLDADVLLVPHHGSKSSSSEGFVQSVSPDLAIVQAGYRNRWRHPDAGVEARYAAVGATVLRSDRDGAITLVLRPGMAPQAVRERLDRPRYWRVAWTEPPAPLNASRRGRRASAP